MGGTGKGLDLHVSLNVCVSFVVLLTVKHGRGLSSCSAVRRKAGKVSLEVVVP